MACRHGVRGGLRGCRGSEGGRGHGGQRMRGTGAAKSNAVVEESGWDAPLPQRIPVPSSSLGIQARLTETVAGCLLLLLSLWIAGRCGEGM